MECFRNNRKLHLRTTFVFLILVLGTSILFAQENYKTNKKLVTEKYIYTSQILAYEVQSYEDKFRKKNPQNIILLIGDGMGVAQIHAGITANQGKLYLDNFKHLGFSKTHSANNYVTDSAAGGTALSCGTKTKNGVIGLDAGLKKIKNVREYAEQAGKATGVVSTSAVTHATPASFVAHQVKRSMYEEIAADFLETDIDVFIGGGVKYFETRKDGRNLSTELKKKGYHLAYTLDDVMEIDDGKLAGLLAPEHMGKTDVRGNMLVESTKAALEILDNDKDGFFLMVEGSQIDWGGHQNNTSFITKEMLDFDRAIGAALEFAARNKNTLVIVTADHETGGMVINKGSLEEKRIEAGYYSTHHSGVIVPVFAFGPGAEQFTGIQDNTEIGQKLIEFARGRKRK